MPPIFSKSIVEAEMDGYDWTEYDVEQQWLAEDMWIYS